MPPLLDRRRHQLDLGHRVVGGELGRRCAAEQRAHDRHRLVEALPAVLEGHSDGLVIALGGAGTEPGDQPSAGEDVERGERLRQRHRATQAGERDRRCQLQIAGTSDDRRERGGPVEPGSGEDEMVVGGERRKAALERRIHGLLEPGEGLPLMPELHQRQMHAEIHSATIARCRAVGAASPHKLRAERRGWRRLPGRAGRSSPRPAGPRCVRLGTPRCLRRATHRRAAVIGRSPSCSRRPGA